MKNTMLRKCFSFIILSVLSMASAYARTAPLVIVAEETVQNMAVNTVQVITYTVHNNVPSPVKLNMEADRTRVIPGSSLVSFQVTDDCEYRGMANYVPPRSDCNVSVTARSGGVAGAVHGSLMINYGPTFQTIAPAPALNFNVTGGGGSGLFFTVQPTGQDIPTHSHEELVWTLSNTTGSAIPLVPGGANFTVASPLIAPPIFTNDCSNSVPASGVCHVQTTIQSLSTPGHVSQYLSVTYHTSSKLVVDVPTNFNITGSSSGTRTFSMVNKCPYPVWFSFAGGGTSFFNCTSGPSCDSHANVQAGTFTCNTNVPTGQCFWKNPVATSYMLDAYTGTYTLQLPAGLYTPQPSQPEVWSGTISGRTGCPTATNSKTTCDTGDCGGTSLHATSGCTTGISPPNIQSEPTFQNNGDFYDITTINGINVPMSMEPVNASISATNPYTCGGAGIATSQTAAYGTIGGCSWDYTTSSTLPPTQAYVWIETAGIACSSSSECNRAGGEACGLTKSDVMTGAGSNVTHCGKWLGYWTADEVCVLNSSYAQAPFNCTSTCTGPDCNIDTSYTDLYGCSGGVAANTCYSVPLPSPLTDCCGCQNWQDAPTNLQVPSNPLAVTQCNGAGNPGWASIVLGKVTWQKAACPSAYAYPHDDPASSFTCTNSATANSVNYRVTYCPGGSSGAPAGVTPNP